MHGDFYVPLNDMADCLLGFLHFSFLADQIFAWNEEKHFAEKWNHKVGIHTEDVGSYSDAVFSIQCNNIQVRNPCTQAKYG